MNTIIEIKKDNVVTIKDIPLGTFFTTAAKIYIRLGRSTSRTSVVEALLLDDEENRIVYFDSSTPVKPYDSEIVLTPYGGSGDTDVFVCSFNEQIECKRGKEKKNVVFIFEFK